MSRELPSRPARPHHLLSRLGSSCRSSGDQGTSAPRGSPMRHPPNVKIKQEEESAGAKSCPTPPAPPAPPPEWLSHHPRRRRPSRSSSQCPWCPRRAGRRRQTQPRSPLCRPEAAAAACPPVRPPRRPAAEPACQPDPGSRERQHAAVSGPRSPPRPLAPKRRLALPIGPARILNGPMGAAVSGRHGDRCC